MDNEQDTEGWGDACALLTFVDALPRLSTSRRRHFVAVRVAEVNAVKRLLRAAGLGHLSKSLGTDAAWAKLLAANCGRTIGTHRPLTGRTPQSGSR